MARRVHRAAPRADPYVRTYRIRLLPRVDGQLPKQLYLPYVDQSSPHRFRHCVRSEAILMTFPSVDPLSSTDSTTVVSALVRPLRRYYEIVRLLGSGHIGCTVIPFSDRPIGN
jgi:hypothetical protein